jgi:hypothetical protein
MIKRHQYTPLFSTDFIKPRVCRAQEALILDGHDIVALSLKHRFAEGP